MDQLIAGRRPCLAGPGIAEVVAHAGGSRREDGEIRAALLLQPQLSIDDAGTDLVVVDGWARRRSLAFAESCNLLRAPSLVLARRSGVMAVAVNDHGASPSPVFTPPVLLSRHRRQAWC